jgi:hypothetical protein
LDSVSHYNISLLEIYPIFLAISIWGYELSNKCILLKCDNIVVVYIINKNTGKDKNIMTILHGTTRGNYSTTFTAEELTERLN